MEFDRVLSFSAVLQVDGVYVLKNIQQIKGTFKKNKYSEILELSNTMTQFRKYLLCKPCIGPLGQKSVISGLEAFVIFQED